MTQTTNYNLNVPVGSDRVNFLTQTFPNFEVIDTTMKANADAGVTLATESKSGTVHTLVRFNKDASVFRFIATTDFVAGETFTLDGVQVTAYTTGAKALTDNAYQIGTTVLCAVNGTVITMYVDNGTAVAADADKLGGQPRSYYAAQSRLDATTVLATARGTNAQNALNEVNTLARRQDITMTLSGTTLNITG